MWRHGDVMIAQVEEVPRGARRLPNAVLAYGEVTGHSHRVEDPKTVEMWHSNGEMFMTVMAEHAAIIHQEHQRIQLPRGTYRVWQQREYTPRAIVRVSD